MRAIKLPVEFVTHLRRRISTIDVQIKFYDCGARTSERTVFSDWIDDTEVCRARLIDARSQYVAIVNAAS